MNIDPSKNSQYLQNLEQKPQSIVQSQYQILTRKQNSLQSPLRKQQIEMSAESDKSFDQRINLTLSMISASTNKAYELQNEITNIIRSAKAIDKEMLVLHNLQKEAIMQLVEAEMNQ